VQELMQVVVCERADGCIVSRSHVGVEVGEQRQAALRDVAQHLSPVRRAPLAPNETRAVELVEQPRDARRFVNHPVANDQRRQAVVSRAPKDPQHVVLLRRGPSPRHNRGKVPVDQRSRSKNAHGHFRLQRMERPPLFDLFLDGGWREWLQHVTLRGRR